MHALSIKFFSSLTLPGQLCLVSAVIASVVNIGLNSSSASTFFSKFNTKSGISSLLSASDGTCIGNTFILKKRSALNSPLSTFFSKSL